MDLFFHFFKKTLTMQEFSTTCTCGNQTNNSTGKAKEYFELLGLLQALEVVITLKWRSVSVSDSLQSTLYSLSKLVDPQSTILHILNAQCR